MPHPAVWDSAESGTQVPGGRGFSNLQLSLEKWDWQPAQQPPVGFSTLERMGWRNSAFPTADGVTQITARGNIQKCASKTAL